MIDPGDGGDYRHGRSRADFVGRIDNPYLPFPPGSRWVYEGESDGETERIEIDVTDDRQRDHGISAVVVRDTVYASRASSSEDTFDWFAQDARGNVWYLGEDSKEYEDGEVVSTRGLVGSRGRRRAPGHRDAGRAGGRRTPTGRSTTPVRRRTWLR